MAVPKKKTSAARRDKRRSHHGLTASFGIVCSNCGTQILAHRACSDCGFYRGKQVMKAKA